MVSFPAVTLSNHFSVVKPERYTLDGLILTGTFNTTDGLASADDGAQAESLTMDLADGNLTSSVILFPQTATSLPLVVNYKGQEYHATLTVPEGEYPVVIRATGLSVEATPQAAPSTRATVDGDRQGVQNVALKMGDVVKEYTVTPNSADNTKATLSRENDPHYWTSRAPITVSAWWPFDNVDITQMPAVKVAEDQSKLADFQKSDFISAENRKVEFNNPTAIKTYNASGNTYEALTAPQTVAAGKPFIRVELGSGTFYFRPQNNVVLEAGSRYKYTVKVNTIGLTLEGCTIGSWVDGGGESGEAVGGVRTLFEGRHSQAATL